MVCVPTAIPKPRRTKTQAKKTPAIQRKTNANQVNGSPGLPAWWASAKSKRRAGDGQRAGQDLGHLQKAERPEENGHQDQTKERFFVNPGAQVADQGRDRRLGPAGIDRREGGLVCSRYENPKSISRLMPRSTTAQTTLSRTIPARIPGENLQS